MGSIVRPIETTSKRRTSYGLRSSDGLRFKRVSFRNPVQTRRKVRVFLVRSRHKWEGFALGCCWLTRQQTVWTCEWKYQPKASMNRKRSMPTQNQLSGVYITSAGAGTSSPPRFSICPRNLSSRSSCERLNWATTIHRYRTTAAHLHRTTTAALTPSSQARLPTSQPRVSPP